MNLYTHPTARPPSPPEPLTACSVAPTSGRYVAGDFRFRFGYCKSNPRKMVQMWAEKEMRNLARLRAAGISAPRPIQLRLHILVMEFVGELGDGVCSR
jgi:RIO kinase 1